MEYVVGFLFSEDGSEVALIRKNKPEWQAGRYNGIGGKIELGERPFNAVRREFEEEAGIMVLGWRLFCVLEGEWGSVHFFTARGNLDNLVQMEREILRIVRVEELANVDTIDNLRWLIPMALDKGNLTADVKEELPFGGW